MRRCGAIGCRRASVRSPSPNTTSSIDRTGTIPRTRNRRRCCRTRATRSRGTGSSTSGSIRRPARPTRGFARACSAAGRISGVAARCATVRCSSTPRAATDSTSIGRSRTTTSSRTTTRSMCCSAARGRRKGSSRCPTVSSSVRTSSIASKSLSSARSRRWGATTFQGARVSRQTACSTNTARSARDAAAAGAAATSERRFTRRRRSSIRRATPAT